MSDPADGREIWLIRHAESEWNALGRWQGHADPGLSARGREQAQALATQVSGERFDALVASDLLRARETAEILGGALGLVPRFDARLRERSVGAWAGLTRDQIAARWPADFARVQRRDRTFRPGGGESLLEVAIRARAFFGELVATPAQRVAVVAHGGLIRALCNVGPVANTRFVRIPLDALLPE